MSFLDTLIIVSTAFGIFGLICGLVVATAFIAEAIEFYIGMWAAFTFVVLVVIFGFATFVWLATPHV